MCINQKYIFTRSKLISPYHRERLLVPVKCGKCYECQQEKQNEWCYRIFHHWKHTLDNNGYILFTTLTYNNENLPTIDRHFPQLTDKFSCFDRADIRSFFTTLDSSLRRLGFLDSKNGKYIDHFLTSEYGSDDRYTHRPHYHVLFFVHSDIPVRKFHEEIFNAWSRGRIDPIRYYGDHSNYFTNKNHGLRSKLAVSNYVSKYVQKSSLFQSEIDKRINQLLDSYVEDRCQEYQWQRQDDGSYRYGLSLNSDYLQSIVRSESYKEYKRKVIRQVDEFILVSKGFGKSALNEITPAQLMENPYLTIPDCKSVVRKYPLFKYYERKLFEEQIEIDGVRYWQPTTLGKLWRKNKEKRLVGYLAESYRVASEFYKIHQNTDWKNFARYLVYYKGRHNARLLSEPTITEKSQLPNVYYNYSCPTDKKQFHEASVALVNNGSVGAYLRPYLVSSIPVSWFIRQKVIDDTYLSEFNGYDKILQDISNLRYRDSIDKQAAYDYKQRLRNVLAASC